MATRNLGKESSNIVFFKRPVGYDFLEKVAGKTKIERTIVVSRVE